MKSGLVLVFLVTLTSANLFSQQQQNGPAPPTAQGATLNSRAKKTEPAKGDVAVKDDAAAAQRQQILDLLDRSHAANDDVLPDQRANLLARQISMVSRLNPETGQKWAMELFQLAEDQSDDQKRGRMQMMAIQMVSIGDAEFALRLLHQMKPVAPGSDPGALMTSNPLSSAAGSVFQALARDKGESQLPRLRQEALRLAAESQYPYSAMGGVAIELLRGQARDRGQLTGDQAALMESVFDEAVSNYERTTPTWSGNTDFGGMMQRVAYQVPRDKVRHALEVFVNNVQATPSPSGMSLKVDSGTGSTQISDPVEIALYHYASLITEFDPELMKQISEAHPKLAQAAAASSNARWSYGDARGSSSGPDANQMTRLRAQGMASWNPDSALAMTQSITDANMRAVTMGSVAEQVAADEPSRALQLLDQAQKTAADTKDAKTELQLVTSRAEVAEATKNSAMLREALRRGFEIGDQLLRQEQDDNKGQVSWYMLGSLVQTGIKNDPDLTLAYIDSFSLPYVRAELLLDAAQALRFSNVRSFRGRGIRTANVVN